MKSLVFASLMVGALILGGVSWNSTAATKPTKQRAVAHFDSPVMLQGVVLKGAYLFVHDDAAMNRGEACTRVYKGEAEVTDKLVLSFHCIPVQRDKVTHFTVRSTETSPGKLEIREFQFNGDTEAHGVPMAPSTAVVTVVN